MREVDEEGIHWYPPPHIHRKKIPMLNAEWNEKNMSAKGRDSQTA